METFTLKFEPIISMTDDQLHLFCSQNPELRIERNAQGEILIMSPAGSESSSRNSRITVQLGIWNKEKKLGITFDSSAGFTLPNKAMRSPDASWIPLDKWNALSPVDKKRFAPLCPDFIVELMSESDALPEAQLKMDEWMANGCRLAWLINPKDETVFIYRPNQPSPEVVQGFDRSLSGETVLVDFRLDLSELR